MRKSDRFINGLAVLLLVIGFVSLAIVFGVVVSFIASEVYRVVT
jgi:hypothetical protein